MKQYFVTSVEDFDLFSDDINVSNIRIASDSNVVGNINKVAMAGKTPIVYRIDNPNLTNITKDDLSLINPEDVGITDINIITAFHSVEYIKKEAEDKTSNDKEIFIEVYNEAFNNAKSQGLKNAEKIAALSAIKRTK